MSDEPTMSDPAEVAAANDRPPAAPKATRKRRSRSKSKPAGRGRPAGASGKIGGAAASAAIKPIHDGLDAYVGLVGAGLCMIPRTQADGVVLLERGPHLVDALCGLAAENPNVRRALRAFVEGGAYGAVILASVNIALPIAANHGLLPFGKVPDLMGTPADMLGALMDTGVVAEPTEAEEAAL